MAAAPAIEYACPYPHCARPHDHLQDLIDHVEAIHPGGAWRICEACGGSFHKRQIGPHRRGHDTEPDPEPVGETETVTADRIRPDDELVFGAQQRWFTVDAVIIVDGRVHLRSRAGKFAAARTFDVPRTCQLMRRIKDRTINMRPDRGTTP
jgi:hypothetical protein